MRERLRESAKTIPEARLFYTDQGVQFTGKAFTGVLKAHDIRISMDGKGRAMDNIFIERLWRSVKYDEIYLNDYATVDRITNSAVEVFLRLQP